jgi:hypothetical protein
MTLARIGTSPRHDNGGRERGPKDEEIVDVVLVASALAGVQELSSRAHLGARQRKLGGFT